MRVSETVTLHFDLSHCPQDAEFTLVAGGGKTHRLTSYQQAPERMARHRAANKALALIPDEHIGRITHFVEEVEIVADHPTVRRVVYPSRDEHPLPEIALVFVHVPTAHQEQFVRVRPSVTLDHQPHLELLANYGVTPDGVDSLDDVDHDELRLHADRIKPPRESAKSLVFQHYEIGSTNSLVAKDVLDHYITRAAGFQDLVTYLEENGPETQNAWYRKTYATWLNPKTNQTEPVTANTDLKYKDGKQPEWPQVDGQPRIPLYDLTDEENNPKDGGVVKAATRVVRNVLVSTKKQQKFNGHLWSTQAGVTTKTQTKVAPTAEATFSTPPAVAQMAVPAAGFGIKNLTSSYGLWLYADELKYENKTLSFPVKNWPSRYLSMYVQFRSSTGEPIKRADIPGWQDPMPEFLRGALEPSDSKNYLGLVSSGNAVFGAPVPFLTQKTDVSFLWPDEASSAHVLFGGLGVAEGFRDWDSEVDIGGIVATGLGSYGVYALSMAFTVYIVNPFIAGLKGDAQIAFYIVCGLAGAIEAAVGGPLANTSWGKFLLTKLAGQVAGVLFGQLTKQILQKVYRDAIEEIIAEAVGEITAEEALGEIPVAGWALKIASVAADIAGLTATTIECLASPATYGLEIQRTMDLTVTVEPDPRHGDGSQQPNWPLVADRWVVQVRYPKTGDGKGGTTYTKSGPMPGPPRNQPLVITFSGIPAGGKIDIVAGVYSTSGWLAGQWDSGWINALPDADNSLTATGHITERLVPLTTSTTYSQKQRVVYSDAKKHHWQATQFSTSADLIPTLDAATVNDALRAAFVAEGSDLSSSVEITVQSKGVKWKVTDTGNGVDYQLDRQELTSGEYEVRVQNLTNAAPKLPSDIHDCGSDGHRLCQLQNLTYNNREYMVGYAWQASGQNMPRDDGNSPDNGQMYTFQAVTALGQPQDRIIEPTRGFSAPGFLAFDQFGLASVGTISSDVDRYRGELNAGGPVPADLANELTGFNVLLPRDAQITVVVQDQRWTIGVPQKQAVVELRYVEDVTEKGRQKVIKVYSWPVPSQDNFYLDTRSPGNDKRQYSLRGVTFTSGESIFDYDSTRSWGQFVDVTLNALAVHPHGYVVGADYDNHKLLTLRLGSDPVADDKAPVAMPLSGEGLREGLLNKPVALTVTADGRILLLEEGNQRIQAFDVLGNPVPCFSVGQRSFSIDKSFAADLDNRESPTPLLQALQRNVVPDTATLFAENDDLAPGSVEALNAETVDKGLGDTFVSAGYTGSDPRFQVDVTTAGSLWLVTDKDTGAMYDLRYMKGDGDSLHLFVFRAFTLSIDVKAAGAEWLITDTANAMTFDIAKRGEADLQVRRLVATMPLRTQGQHGVRYLDVAVETTGYIYTLSSDDNTNEYTLDVYQPDGTPLFHQPGVYAGKLGVDQWRSLFTLNYEKILGPGQRTEPGLSQWIPSTPM